MGGLGSFLRLHNYGVEDGVKFGTKNFVGERNQFSLGARGSNDPTRRGESGRRCRISIFDNLLRHKNEVNI